MAKLLKLRRGTTTQHSSFTGAEGEVTIDTTKDTAVVHDGSQAGGRPLAREDMSNVSSASIAGRLGTDSIATSKIAAGTLPSDVVVSGSNIAAGAIHNSDINASAAIANSKLADSGVTAGAYGSSSAIPIVTVNAKGVGTAASTTAIDSTKIQNGTSEVSVANNANVTIVRGGTTIVNVSGGGIGITGDMSITGNVDGVDVAALKVAKDSLSTSAGVLVNGVTATTQSTGDNSTKVATTGYVRNAITAHVFPSGTKMLFHQTSAPTGWTKVTTHNNKALRVVSGSAGSGGSNAFTTAFAARGINANAGNTTAGGNVSVSVANSTQGGNVSIANATQGGNVSIANANTSGTVNNHTLSTNQMPSHSHNVTLKYSQHNCRGGGCSGGIQPGSSNSSAGSNATSNTGGNGGHSHGFSGSSHSHNASFSGSAHSHNASFSGSAHNHNANGSFSGTAHNHSISVGNLDMAVQYIDVIIATKD